MRYSYIILLLIFGCNGQTKTENKLLDYKDKEVTIKVFQDEEEVTNFDLHVFIVRDNSTDTVNIKSKENKITIPLYDSTMMFFRVRYKDFNVDFSDLFLKYELPTLLDPTVINWYFVIDTPPFKGLAQAYEKEIRHVIGLYADNQFMSGVSIPIKFESETQN